MHLLSFFLNLSLPMNDHLQVFKEIPELSTKEAESKYESLTLSSFDLLEHSINWEIGDLLMDIGCANELTSILQEKLFTMVQELVCVLHV